jgi:hypothetical protein
MSDLSFVTDETESIGLESRVFEYYVLHTPSFMCVVVLIVNAIVVNLLASKFELQGLCEV